MRHVPYRAREFAKNTYIIDMGAICDCYLLVGAEKALLIDTGMGQANLRAYVETITDKPIMVVNTHGHMDHTLCNGYFDEVYMHPEAIIDSNGGKWSESEYKDGPWPDFNPIPVEEGYVFDLGDRHIEVLETPCHSPGDLMFIDKENKLLFTGDNLEVGQVLIFYGTDKVGGSVAQHLKMMKKVYERIDEYDMICPAHNGAPISKDHVQYYIENDERILSGIEGTSDIASPTFGVQPGGDGPFSMSEERFSYLRCSEWKGTSLVYDVRRVEGSERLWHIGESEM